MLALALRHGIRRGVVTEIVRHFCYTSPDPLLESWPWPVKIRTLGTFEIEVHGQALRYGRKTPKRLLSLLQYIVAQGGRDIPEHRIADALWPDADGDEAYRRLVLTVHRLRLLIGDAEAIRFSGGKISLNPKRVWVDALCMINAREVRSSTDFQAMAVSVYAGEFLENETQETWMLPMRQKLRQLHSDALRNIGNSAQTETKKKAPLS